MTVTKENELSGKSMYVLCESVEKCFENFYHWHDNLYDVNSEPVQIDKSHYMKK